MAQYEWVDVYSLKRWGDPATDGTVGGSFGSGGTLGESNIQWGENIDFTTDGLFSYYYENKNGAIESNSKVVSNNIRIGLSYIYKTKLYNTPESTSFSLSFIMCDKFDAFKNLNLTNFKTVEFTNLSVDFYPWTLYFVLEDGIMCRTTPYSTAVNNVSIRVPIEKLTITDNRFIGRFLMLIFRSYNISASTYAFVRDLVNDTSINSNYTNYTEDLHNTNYARYVYSTSAYFSFNNIKFLK